MLDRVGPGSPEVSYCFPRVEKFTADSVQLGPNPGRALKSLPEHRKRNTLRRGLRDCDSLHSLQFLPPLQDDARNPSDGSGND
jgi:hypothetical protein